MGSRYDVAAKKIFAAPTFVYLSCSFSDAGSEFRGKAMGVNFLINDDQLHWLIRLIYFLV